MYEFKRRAFYTDGKRCRGITKLLSKHVGSAPRSFGETGGSGGGVHRGRLVDREIHACVTRGTPPRHVLSKAFFAILKKLKLKAIKTQVACGVGLIATAVDVVAKDSKGRIVLIEQKCGYQNTAKARPMKGLFKHILATADNVAFAQLGMTKHLYEQCFGKKVRALYIRLHNKGGVAKKLPKTFRGAVIGKLLEQISAAPTRPRAKKA